MIRRVLVICFMIIFAVSLGGCATARRQKDLEMQGLRNKVSVLEAQVQSKDEEINSLRETIAGAAQEKETRAKEVSKKRIIAEVKSRPNVKQIQTALANAGYNLGVIDGRMGRQTKDAVRSFQKANNLSVDGKVGKKTWNLLKGYLYKKVK